MFLLVCCTGVRWKPLMGKQVWGQGVRVGGGGTEVERRRHRENLRMTRWERHRDNLRMTR